MPEHVHQDPYTSLVGALLLQGARQEKKVMPSRNAKLEKVPFTEKTTTQKSNRVHDVLVRMLNATLQNNESEKYLMSLQSSTPDS